LIGIINTKTIIYKRIAGNSVFAWLEEVDAAPVVVADIVACYAIVAGSGEVDAAIGIVDFVACYCVVVAGKGEDDAIRGAADIVAGYGVVAWTYHYPFTTPKAFWVCYGESFKCNSIST